MRAFIAVELPEAIRESLSCAQRGLAQAGADVRWASSDQLHVTLRFLGEIDEAQRASLDGILQAAAEGLAPFDMALSDLGAFPSLRAPRVIWVGVGQGAQPLARLAQRIEDGLRGLAVQREEHAFVAHVTLGRVRSPAGKAQLLERLGHTAWSAPAPWRVEQVTLFQSVLARAGATHLPLARYALRGS